MQIASAPVRFRLAWLALFSLIGSPDADADPLWSQSVGGFRDDGGFAVAPDGAGNTFVLCTLDFDAENSDLSTSDYRLAKYNVNGNVTWSRQFDGAGWIAHDLAVTPAGEVVVVGGLAGSVDFGGGPLTPAAGIDAFLAKFDASGSHQWSRRLGGASADIATAVAVTSDGSIDVVGWHTGSTNLGGANLAHSGSSDVFVAQFDAGGNHVWSKSFGGAGMDMPSDVVVDSQDDLILAGKFSGTVNFGGGARTSSGAEDIFMLKMSDAGNHTWSHRFGDVDFDNALGVAVDDEDSILLTGYIGSDVSFGGAVLATTGLRAMFVAKFAAGASHTWSRAFGQLAEGWSVAVSDPDRIFVTGRFATSIDFGQGQMLSRGDYDGFLLRLDQLGSTVDANQIGGSGADGGQDVVHDKAGGVLVAGHFSQTVDFGGAQRSSSGLRDGFVMAYPSPAVPVAVQGQTATRRPGIVELRWRVVGASPQMQVFVERARLESALYRTIPELQLTRDEESFQAIDATVEAGVDYSYRVTMLQPGENTLSFEIVLRAPAALITMDQNFPNPFNPSTRIHFTLDGRTRVRLAIFDARGQLVTELMHEELGAGAYDVDWNGRDSQGRGVRSGTYFFELRAGDRRIARKALLLK